MAPASRAWTSRDLEQLAQDLCQAFADTGDRRLARAAAELAPRGPGRPEHDDGRAIERMAALLEADPALKLFTAARMVAEEAGGCSASTRSTAQRLADKYRRGNGPERVQETPQIK